MLILCAPTSLNKSVWYLSDIFRLFNQPKFHSRDQCWKRKKREGLKI
jgi:hypothetical protein